MKYSRNSILVTVLIATMLPLALMVPEGRAAGLQPDSYRVGKVIDKFDDTWQFAVAFKLGRPKRLLAQYVDLTLRVITAPGESRPFIQHTSNGGLNSTNPGMDIVGISFGYDFGH